MDRRTTPNNGDVAAIELRGKVEARQFVEGEKTRVIAPVADLRCTVDAEQLDRQLLRGDQFRVFVRKGGYAFGQADRGSYVGYVAEHQLDGWLTPSHWVCARASFAFERPDFKAPHPLFLSHGSRENVIGKNGRFSQLSDGRFVPTVHLRSLNDPATDPVAEAQKHLGVPYLWGGNSAFGLDCSGLVQSALLACNVPCPGDSDLQETAFSDALGTYQRGDLLFWKGHVAMVVDSDTLIHANAYHMAVSYEDITQAILRIEQQGDGPVTSHRRPILKGST